jgi:hypothetical protein
LFDIARSTLKVIDSIETNQRLRQAAMQQAAKEHQEIAKSKTKPTVRRAKGKEKTAKEVHQSREIVYTVIPDDLVTKYSDQLKKPKPKKKKQPKKKKSTPSIYETSAEAQKALQPFASGKLIEWDPRELSPPDESFGARAENREAIEEQKELIRPQGNNVNQHPWLVIQFHVSVLRLFSFLTLFLLGAEKMA